MGVMLRLDHFGRKALAARLRGGASREAIVSKAVRYYLADRGNGRLAWRFPRFLSGDDGDEPAGTDVTLDDETMAAVEREARRQGVSPGRLAEHALLYFLADLDCGRALTARKPAALAQARLPRGDAPREGATAGRTGNPPRRIFARGFRDPRPPFSGHDGQAARRHAVADGVELADEVAIHLNRKRTLVHGLDPQVPELAEPLDLAVAQHHPRARREQARDEGGQLERRRAPEDRDG